MIEIRGLTKRYGATTAVDDLTVTVAPGRVTGFLGPNGAGKSTTLRIVLGLVHPTAGTATVAGRPYAALDHPLRRVGALLDARAVHPGRTARHHLEALAVTNGISRARVEEVLGLVGLADRADDRAGGFSLGMGQRLGIAAALLGDPEVLVLDEPVNGLDTDGIRWVRTLVRGLAAEGRTVLVSSHLMAEVELTVDHLVVIGRGRLLADAPVADVVQRGAGERVRVASPAPDLPRLLERAGAVVTAEAGGTWRVDGTTAAAVGELAAAHGLVLHRLEPARSTLEEAYTAMTHDSVEHEAGR
ncbi:MAG TPA: ABC transporter ATP-binding protein [Iamia sp.]|nr:ABC transporter ATP-binding protein [Iamia sp.]